MLNFLRKNRSGKAAVAALAAVTVFSLAGCGGEKAAAPQATLVKSMQVIKRDTPLVYDYTGFVQAQQEMELKAQVSGQITGKRRRYRTAGAGTLYYRPAYLSRQPFAGRGKPCQCTCGSGNCFRRCRTLHKTLRAKRCFQTDSR